MEKIRFLSAPIRVIRGPLLLFLCVFAFNTTRYVFPLLPTLLEPMSTRSPLVSLAGNMGGPPGPDCTDPRLHRECKWTLLGDHAIIARNRLAIPWSSEFERAAICQGMPQHVGCQSGYLESPWGSPPS